MGLAEGLIWRKAGSMEINTQIKRVVVLGATGTAGHAAARALVAAGHDVICYGRRDPQIFGAKARLGQVSDSTRLRKAMQGVDVVVSCLASRTGAPKDAWLVDHDAQVQVLEAAKAEGVAQFVLLSAICVQKPLLAFQKAKLAFEAQLAASGLGYSIVRPTAFFKSVSGQVGRLRLGKPFLVFGDGTLTACKPISDDDLGRFIARCLTQPDKLNRVLPIGGPGPAMTPMEQGNALFAALGIKPKFKKVPVGLLQGIQRVLAGVGKLSPKAAEKAELARIGIYYATESMLVWDDARGAYDADATPEFGAETLSGFYQQLAAGEATIERGEHAVF